VDGPLRPGSSLGTASPQEIDVDEKSEPLQITDAAAGKLALYMAENGQDKAVRVRLRKGG